VNRLTLKMKLGVGFGSLLLLLVAMGYLAYSSVGQLAEMSSRAEQIMTKTYLASQIEAALEKQTAGARAFLLAGREDLLKHDEEGKRQFADSMEKLNPLLSAEGEHRLYSEIQSSYGEYRATLDHEIQLRRASQQKDAIDLAFSAQTSETRNRLRQATGNLVQLQNKFKEEIVKEQSALQARVRVLVGLLAFAGLVLGIGIAMLITRSITSATTEMVALIQEIAANNLAIADLEVSSKDETGRAGPEKP